MVQSLTRWLLGVFLFLVLLMQNCNLTPDPAYILNRFTLNFGFDYLPYLLYIIWGWYLGQREYGRRTLWLAPLVFLLTAVLTTAGNIWYSNYRGYADGWLFSLFLPAELHHGKRDVLLLPRSQGTCFQACKADTPALRLYPRRLSAASAYVKHA